jgi:hypothetical protein
VSLRDRFPASILANSSNDFSELRFREQREMVVNYRKSHGWLATFLAKPDLLAVFADTKLQAESFSVQLT